MSKAQFLEYRIQQALVEGDGFDLLVMGRPEGPGCYCYANNLIRRSIDLLSGNYPYLIVDNEAGMEHLSRRTTIKVDLLLLVSDGSKRGLISTQRIFELASELKLTIKSTRLVINRCCQEPAAWQQVVSADIQLAGLIPEDELLSEYDAKGIPLVNLPQTSVAKMAVTNLMQRLLVP